MAQPYWNTASRTCLSNNTGLSHLVSAVYRCNWPSFGASPPVWGHRQLPGWPILLLPKRLTNGDWCWCVVFMGEVENFRHPFLHTRRDQHDHSTVLCSPAPGEWKGGENSILLDHLRRGTVKIKWITVKDTAPQRSGYGRSGSLPLQPTATSQLLPGT